MPASAEEETSLLRVESWMVMFAISTCGRLGVTADETELKGETKPRPTHLQGGKTYSEKFIGKNSVGELNLGYDLRC